MRTINVLGPVGFNPTGTYDATRTYQKLDVVYYQGSSYVAISDSLGQLPTNSEYWNCIATGALKQFTYDSVAEMKLDNSLENGMCAKTLGYYEKNDGGKGLYKIRTITNEDVVDEKLIVALADNTLIAELILDDVVNIKCLGAKGDDTTDDTSVFEYAQNLHRTIYVPAGNYVVNNFTFTKGIKWQFQTGSGTQWFSSGGAVIKTSTGLTISGGPEINNLVVRYNGTISDKSLRPIGIKLKSHFCTIKGLHIQDFYIGIACGVLAGGHVDYTKLYDVYSWYNYYAGLVLDGDSSNQVNFISLYDCNIGSNGVDPHDNTKEPVLNRGYGVYIGNCNAITINNGDFSSNETCSFYIDNPTTSKQTRGLTVTNCYAEQNKYCDIYYNNAGDSSRTRTVDVNFISAYFYHSSANIYYIGELYLASQFIPSSVKFMDYPNVKLEDKTCILYDLVKHKGMSYFTNAVKDIAIVLKRLTSYKISITLKGTSTGYLTAQNIVSKLYNTSIALQGTSYLQNSTRISILSAANIPVVEDTTSTYDLYVTMPDSDTDLVWYQLAGYGATAELIDLNVEEIPFIAPSTGANTPQIGAIRMNGTTPQIYVNGAWKDITIS